MAFGINDMGQVVGGTGVCANTVQGGFASTPHAVLWDLDGTVHLLPGLGGLAPDMSVLAVGTQAFSINSHGIITGQATLANNTTFHPVLWQDEIISDLGVLPGDLVGAGLSINNRGEVVGASVSAPGPSTGNPRAFFWRDGVMSDLNDLVQSDAPLYLLTAFGINDAGDIVGFGATDKGAVHGFLATPCREDAACSNASTGAKAARSVVLSEDARKTLLSHGLRRR
jgi:probable HAF family extracellular repeat protein